MFFVRELLFGGCAQWGEITKCEVEKFVYYAQKNKVLENFFKNFITKFIFLLTSGNNYYILFWYDNRDFGNLFPCSNLEITT